MADNMEKIPEKVRWETATRELTGACTAVSNALRQAVGQEKFEELNGTLWYEAGKGAKPFADSLGVTAKDAGAIEQVINLMARVAMGPELGSEVVESTNDKCVGRTTECPWHKRWKEQGLSHDACSVGHQRWGDGAVESLSPDFKFTLTKNMLRGDPYCEWVVERKK